MRQFNILLVEDNIEHAYLINKYINDFKKPKMNLIVEHDGTSAFKFIKSHYHLHLFILDIKLPDISGDTLLRFIRTTKHYRNHPVIILTSSDSLLDKKRCDDFFVDLYITKNSELSINSLSRMKSIIDSEYKKWLKKGD